ncbi:hypothetical protein [Jeotgalibacillus marinus]|uniref:Uncharacterized protein n=1 Tax=Jeotgalibacillus marinus TaxID=86667 RepID=A0ABV3Q2C1_9BACL
MIKKITSKLKNKFLDTYYRSRMKMLGVERSIIFIPFLSWLILLSLLFDDITERIINYILSLKIISLLRLDTLYTSLNIINILIENIDNIVYFQITISITIYVFVYKEIKKVSYTESIKYEPIALYIYQFLICISVLIFHNKYTIDEQQIRVLPLFLLNIYACSLYINTLIRSTNIFYNLEKHIKRLNKLALFINTKRAQEKKIDRSLKYYLQNVSTTIQTSFQLLSSSLKHNNFKETEADFDKFNIAINEIFGEKGVDDNFRYIAINERDQLIETYKHLLKHYSAFIHQSSKADWIISDEKLLGKFMDLMPPQNEQTKNPIKNNKNLSAVYSSTNKYFFSSLFKIIKKTTKSEDVHISIIINVIDDYINTYSLDLNDMEDRRLLNTVILIRGLILKEAESNNVRNLTEWVYELLEINKKSYEDQDEIVDTKKTSHLVKTIKAKKDTRHDQPLTSIKVYFDPTPDDEKIYKNEQIENIQQNITDISIEIFFESLMKSIELGTYKSTGLLVKVLCSNFTEEDIMMKLKSYMNTKNKNKMPTILSSDLNGIVCPNISDFSERHCIQKLTVLILYQIYDKNESKFESIEKIIPCLEIFNSNKELEYALTKIKRAGYLEYGLLSVENKQLHSKLFFLRRLCAAGS